MKHVAILIAWLLIATFVIWMAAGCATTKKLVETDTPQGYACKVHGANPKSYKVGEKYYCTDCVNQNLEKVELVWNSLPTTGGVTNGL